MCMTRRACSLYMWVYLSTGLTINRSKRNCASFFFFFFLAIANRFHLFYFCMFFFSLFKFTRLYVWFWAYSISAHINRRNEGKMHPLIFTLNIKYNRKKNKSPKSFVRVFIFIFFFLYFFIWWNFGNDL